VKHEDNVTADKAQVRLDEVLGGPADSKTLAATIAQRLRALILDGQLQPGARLPLTDIAASLGVSVMPVREALSRLEAERLVVMRPRRGAIVARLTVEDAEEIYAMRVALEALCARRAAERLRPSDVADLEDIFRQLETAHETDNLDAFIACDRAFHSHLYEISGRDRLVRNIHDLQDRCRRYLPHLYHGWEMAENPVEAHRPLLTAIQARDPVLVERLTREHMQQAADRLLKEIMRQAEGQEE
jgi:DNA-binding GntR family transcriptional regulator